MLLITKITNFCSLKIALLLVHKHFELPPSEVLELFQFEERQIYLLKGPTVEWIIFASFHLRDVWLVRTVRSRAKCCLIIKLTVLWLRLSARLAAGAITHS